MSSPFQQAFAMRTRTRRKSTRPRDSQRSKVYKSEDAIFRKSWPPRDPFFPEAEFRFETVEEVQAWVDGIQKSKWWAKQGYTKRKIKVHPGRASSSAFANTAKMQIRMPYDWSRRKWVILHEMAHITADLLYEEDQRHGRGFCSVYLKLVERWIGVEEARALRKSFVEHNVRYRNKRVMTPIDKQKAAERFRQNVLKKEL